MSEVAALLAWYDARRRELPWRKTRDPYRIWVSEVMLQQTRVGTVLPYYEAFLQRFPTVEDLASAPVDEVLARWSGLGYYRRARQLHRAAREIVERGGKFPTSARELQSLPGIGPYTAAAVASIAFGEVTPALDGNVERLLCRRLGLREDPKRSATRRELLAAAARLLDRGRPGDSNQALMELGATVCKPAQPDCAACVLAPGCRARRRGDPERYPAPRRRRRTERRELDGFVRPEYLHRGRWRLAEAGARVRHAITYRALELHVYRARFEAGGTVAEGPEAAWVGAEDRRRFPVSSMVEKVLAQVDR